MRVDYMRLARQLRLSPRPEIPELTLRAAGMRWHFVTSDEEIPCTGLIIKHGEETEFSGMRYNWTAKEALICALESLHHRLQWEEKQSRVAEGLDLLGPVH